MRSPLTYSTKAIDEALKRKRLKWEQWQAGNYEGWNFWEIINQKLDQRIQEQQYDWIINSLNDFCFYYHDNAEYYLQIDIDTHKAKENNYLAALTVELIYLLLEKGFSHHIFNSGMLCDLKKNNFGYTRHAILANEPEMALRIAAEDTLLGALLLQDYERAQTMLPEKPEDFSKHDEIGQCLWGIAHGNEKVFNKYLEKRIRALRRQAKIHCVTIDSSGLAVIKLASQRGIVCHLDVIELPQSLLDDERIDTSNLVLPIADKINAIQRPW
ncbi:MAG: hypothetical protein K2O32_15980 [Acetatifactor sp.]|nr:hypothetical protein [Acetatifactor sp.]